MDAEFYLSTCTYCICCSEIAYIIIMVETIIISTVVVTYIQIVYIKLFVCGPVYVWLICHIMCVCCTGITF